MSKSSYRPNQSSTSKGPSRFVKGTSLALALLVIVSIIATLVRQY